MTMRTRKPRVGGPMPDRPGHRTLLYCDDATVPQWGFWCRDCDAGKEPYTQSKQAAEKVASRHSVATVQAKTPVGS